MRAVLTHPAIRSTDAAVRARTVVVGRGSPIGRERTGAVVLELELAAVARQLALQSEFAGATRDDGWQVCEILAHCADIAEVFCERLVPGSCPGGATTAVRRRDGSVDLDATNDRLRAAHGRDPVAISLERLGHCVRVVRNADVSVGTHAALRVHEHTLEHLAEIAVITGCLARESTEARRSAGGKSLVAISAHLESQSPTSR